MISTEEKIEIMQRERKAYKEGYRDGLRWLVVFVAVLLVCVSVVIIIV